MKNINWQKPFFEEMEKMAVMGLILGGMTAAGTLADIKANKAKTRLAAPTAASAVSARDPYSHQFKRSTTYTPGRSLFS